MKLEIRNKHEIQIFKIVNNLLKTVFSSFGSRGPGLAEASDLGHTDLPFSRCAGFTRTLVGSLSHCNRLFGFSNRRSYENEALSKFAFRIYEAWWGKVKTLQVNMISLRIIPALSIVLTIVGCAAKPDRHEFTKNLDASVPAQWTARQAEQVGETLVWLDDFDDPNVGKLIGEALLHNHDFSAATSRLEAAFARKRIVASDRRPQVAADFGASRTKRTSSSGFQITNSRINNYNLGLNSRWELDLWGALRNQDKAAMADLLAEHGTISAARLSLAISGNFQAKGDHNCHRIGDHGLKRRPEGVPGDCGAIGWAERPGITGTV